MAQRLPPFSRRGTSGLPTAASPRSSRLPVPSSDTGTASCAGSTAKIANGLIEGINSLVLAAKAKARGYRSTRNLKAIVYLLAGKLDLALPA
jgi:hypothetical protein